MGGSAGRARAEGLTKAGQILARTHSDLIVSKQKLRQADGMALVRSSARKANRICASVRDHLSSAACPFGRCHRDSSFMSGETATSSFRLSGIPSLVFLMVRTGLSRFFSPHLPCGRSRRRSGSGVLQRCWPRSACRKGERNTDVS